MLKVPLFLLAAAPLFADGQAALRLGEPHRLIADKVRVRTEPNVNSEVITELKIGSEVIPLEETKYRHTQDCGENIVTLSRVQK